MKKKRLITVFWALVMCIPICCQTTDWSWHPWTHKRVAYFGDSITDPNNKASKKKYWDFLQDWLGITPLVYGVSGYTWITIPRLADKLKKEHGLDFDAIMVLIGTNDYNEGIRIGEWYDEHEDSVVAAAGWLGLKNQKYIRRKRTPCYNPSTYRGRINIAMHTLKSMFPAKQIVLATPLHRAYFESGQDNIQPAEEYQNACGEYLDKYVESVKEAAGIWGVPVIDLYSVSGLFPLIKENAKLYSHSTDKDRLHPNDAGHRRIAMTMAYQLAMLPGSF